MGLRRAAYQRTLQAPRWRRRATTAHWPHPPDCYKRQQKQAKRLQPTRLRHASAAEMRLSRRQAGRLAIDVDKGLRRHSGGRQGPQLRRPPAHDVDKGPSSVSQKRVTCLARETPSPARYSAHLASQCDTGRPATRLVQPANLRSRNGIATAESNDEKVRRRESRVREEPCDCVLIVETARSDATANVLLAVPNHASAISPRGTQTRARLLVSGRIVTLRGRAIPSLRYLAFLSVAAHSDRRLNASVSEQARPICQRTTTEAERECPSGALVNYSEPERRAHATAVGALSTHNRLSARPQAAHCRDVTRRSAHARQAIDRGGQQRPNGRPSEGGDLAAPMFAWRLAAIVEARAHHARQLPPLVRWNRVARRDATDGSGAWETGDSQRVGGGASIRWSRKPHWLRPEIYVYISLLSENMFYC
ncbi:hypothetical protein HPB51_001976 [Rhipicephalus microplus]|uniref:Uncharacterized protein n=1 Tax=Rhipicephalus microplus TaxID=6941 RepID=A0A9J6D8F8_RHIMP|nr:hypothetical protein HPB51_001976 [Rhipicephalus microplus]